MTKNMGRPVLNKHKVPSRQWRKWSNHARRVFNSMYHAMRPRTQVLFLHPEASPIRRTHWQTLRWNAAWEAACAAEGRSHVKDVLQLAA